MECDLCMRSSTSKVPFCCPSCVRSILYEPRIRNAQILLEKEQLTSRIERIHPLGKRVDGKSKGPDIKQDSLALRKLSIQGSNIEKTQSEDRTNAIREHTKILKDEIQAAREEIAQRKAILQKKRLEWDNIDKAVPERRIARTAKIQDGIQKASHSWDAIHNKAIETRSFLCREAAHLHGLRQRKKMRGGVVKDQYTIGGVSLVDLKDINSVKVNELTTSLNSVAHLVVLVSFYLSIRLPAEIALPHRNYPLPTILTPANSYQDREIPFPGTTPTPSSTSSPVGSRHTDLRPLPRPRPLFIEPENLKDKIPQVAKRDPTAFAFFLEGISLLAWDIAWLCRSQGMNAGTESWEDVCNMGRNLWNLLISPPQSPALLRVMSGRDARQQRTITTNINSAESYRSLRLGHFSHDSAYSFPANGADFLRGWKLAKYTTIVDPLKRGLIGEMSNAEWEMLEQDEWDDGGEQFREDDAVFIKNRNSADKGGRSSFDDARSIMTARTERRSEDRGDEIDAGKEAANADAAAAAAAGSARAKGTSGWTKVKNREK
jgi:Vacuolar sorting 38 and autophagy-related subunit 14